MTPDAGKERAIWKAALQPRPDCIPIEKLAGPLADVEAKHLATCARCQAELALQREFISSVVEPDEGAAVSWIAAELQRRATAETARRPSWWQRLVQLPSYRLSGALAGVLLLAGIFTVYTLRSRTGTAPRVISEDAYRSQSVVPVSPLGDLDSTPAELRWQPVPGAVKYQVRIVEVDRREIWTAETPQTSVSIPGQVRAMIVPGKTLLWEAKALSRTSENLATSGLRKFRVKVKKTSGDEL
ncbi:MAG: hypothetical protein U0Q18_04325 [Bryobacteraceae bacterium]